VPRFFFPSGQLQGNQATISGQEFDHLRRVLRLRPGNPVTLFDGRGWEHEGVIESLDADRAVVAVSRSYRPERESPLDVTLAQGLGKGDKMDLVVEKATELGVSRLIPFLSAYTVPKLDKRRLEIRQERWRKIALSAAKQSGRTRVPDMVELREFSAVIGEPWPCELKLLFWEKEPEGSLLQLRTEHPHVRSVLLVVGPEGGFSAGEAEQARRQGFRSIHFGRRTLRTETAALATLSVVQCLWGDLG
jgi:16S rRNA (uracil1498-N3)-methyltransferase